MIRRPPRSTLFPYTRSSDLSTSNAVRPYGEAQRVWRVSINIFSSGGSGASCCSTVSKVRSSRSEEHTSELQSLAYLVCRLLLEKKKKIENNQNKQLINLRQN